MFCRVVQLCQRLHAVHCLPQHRKWPREGNQTAQTGRTNTDRNWRKDTGGQPVTKPAHPQQD